jgi:hypothetical protein
MDVLELIRKSDLGFKHFKAKRMSGFQMLHAHIEEVKHIFL